MLYWSTLLMGEYTSNKIAHKLLIILESGKTAAISFLKVDFKMWDNFYQK